MVTANHPVARVGGKNEIEQIAGETRLPSWPRGWAAYLMTHR